MDKLVLPEEMIHKRVDKQAMMTYLAQFRNLKDTNAAYRVRAFGEGLHKGRSPIHSSTSVSASKEARRCLLSGTTSVS